MTTLNNILNTYQNVFEESLKSINTIKEKYPNLESDIINMKHIMMLKENNPELTKNELIAHAFTFMLLIHLINYEKK